MAAGRPFHGSFVAIPRSPLCSALAFTQGESCRIRRRVLKTGKIQKDILIFLLGVLFLIINEKWYLPFLNWYVDTVHCYTPFGYSGISVMWYSLFVGIPLFCAFIIGIVTVPIGYKGIIHKQFPPKGMKVYKPTKILRSLVKS